MGIDSADLMLQKQKVFLRKSQYGLWNVQLTNGFRVSRGQFLSRNIARGWAINQGYDIDFDAKDPSQFEYI